MTTLQAALLNESATLFRRRYYNNGSHAGFILYTKDDFLNIKNVSRDDVLAAHRIPPQLMGIVPGNTGGFGAVLPAAQVFARNEIEPLQVRFRELMIGWGGSGAV